MAANNDWDRRAGDAFQPVTDMLNVGRCEPLKAAVHGLMLATVTVCAAYNAAAWLKRRERHLAFNAVIYGFAIWWERTHVMHHLIECEPVKSGPVGGLTRVTGPAAKPLDTTEGPREDAA
jgi:hypothetical protein